MMQEVKFNWHYLAKFLEVPYKDIMKNGKPLDNVIQELITLREISLGIPTKNKSATNIFIDNIKKSIKFLKEFITDGNTFIIVDPIDNTTLSQEYEDYTLISVTDKTQFEKYLKQDNVLFVPSVGKKSKNDNIYLFLEGVGKHIARRLLEIMNQVFKESTEVPSKEELNLFAILAQATLPQVFVKETFYGYIREIQAVMRKMSKEISNRASKITLSNVLGTGKDDKNYIVAESLFKLMYTLEKQTRTKEGGITIERDILVEPAKRLSDLWLNYELGEYSDASAVKTRQQVKKRYEYFLNNANGFLSLYKFERLNPMKGNPHQKKVWRYEDLALKHHLKRSEVENQERLRKVKHLLNTARLTPSQYISLRKERDTLRSLGLPKRKPPKLRN